uniref:Uncharacterized protein n=1 Tax=Anguilla anguilla TaxID=7936 RepID=A0A0E9Q8P5_ANGAN
MAEGFRLCFHLFGALFF